MLLYCFEVAVRLTGLLLFAIPAVFMTWDIIKKS